MTVQNTDSAFLQAGYNYRMTTIFDFARFGFANLSLAKKMKRESSYNQVLGKPLVLKAVLVLSCITCQATSVCRDNSQCPGDQVCIIEGPGPAAAADRISDFKLEVRISVGPNTKTPTHEHPEP